MNTKITLFLILVIINLNESLVIRNNRHKREDNPPLVPQQVTVVSQVPPNSVPQPQLAPNPIPPQNPLSPTPEKNPISKTKPVVETKIETEDTLAGFSKEPPVLDIKFLMKPEPIRQPILPRVVQDLIDQSTKAVGVVSSILAFVEEISHYLLEQIGKNIPIEFHKIGSGFWINESKKW